MLRAALIAFSTVALPLALVSAELEENRETAESGNEKEMAADTGSGGVRPVPESIPRRQKQRSVKLIVGGQSEDGQAKQFKVPIRE